jgi:hypothetical protein
MTFQHGPQDVVDMFTGHYQTTHVFSRDLCIATAIHATIFSFIKHVGSMMDPSRLQTVTIRTASVNIKNQLILSTKLNLRVSNASQNNQ